MSTVRRQSASGPPSSSQSGSLREYKTARPAYPDTFQHTSPPIPNETLPYDNEDSFSNDGQETTRE